MCENTRTHRRTAALPPHPPFTRPPYLLQAFIAPSGPLQLWLQSLWQRLLGCTEPISVHTSFFDVGGNSLLVMRLLSTIRAAYSSMQLQMHSFFAHPSIEGACRGTPAMHTPTLALNSDPSIQGIRRGTCLALRGMHAATHERTRSLFEAPWMALEP